LKTHILGLQNNIVKTDDSQDGFGQNMLSFQLHLEKRDPLKMLMPETLKSPTIVNNKSNRKISKIPFKVLDAPALQDDFYLNLLDWSESNL